jgi:hypothetical protein
MRPLSIPAVRDRIMQAAVKIVLEAVFEADFLPVGFGFRPRRSAHDGLQVHIDECWRAAGGWAGTDIALRPARPEAAACGAASASITGWWSKP